LIVSHAPFWHNGSRVTHRNYHIMLATLPAVLAGIYFYGIPVFGVLCLSVATAMFWELAINRVSKQPVTIGDGNAALIGLLIAMLFPATMPWWAVITGTFIAVVIGKQIFGGIGSNAFNPIALAVAIMMISWKDLLVRCLSLKRSTIDHTSQKETVFSANVFLDLLRTTNATVESTKELDIKV